MRLTNKISKSLTLSIKRPGQTPATFLTLRDLQVLETLVLSRCMSMTQLGRLFFPLYDGSISPRGRLRMAQLAAAGLTRSIEQPQTHLDGRKAKVHFPTEKGRLLVASELGHDPHDLPRPASIESSWGFLDHTLLCNEVRVLATLGAPKAGVSLTHWLPDYALRKLHMRPSKLKNDQIEQEKPKAFVPDGQFEVVGGGHYRFFLEADRGTIPAVSKRRHRDWRARVGMYLRAKRRGRIRELYGSHRFRVLTVVPSQGRLESLKAATEEAGGEGLFWFAAVDDLSPESLYSGEVWAVAGREGRYELLW